jgi:hemolysin III
MVGPGERGTVWSRNVPSGVVDPPALSVPSGTLRLSGSALTPRWRGRLHLWALVVFAPAAMALIVRRPALPVIVYALALVTMFAVSAGYHLPAWSVPWRRRMRQADHAMIYLYTAASYTPLCWRAVRGDLGDAVLALVWLGALVGVSIKAFGFDRRPVVGSALYLVLGWLAVVIVPAAARTLSATELSLLVGMGGVYTIGAVVLFTCRPDPVPHLFGYHEVWHGCVVLASACYLLVIWGLVGRTL